MQNRVETIARDRRWHGSSRAGKFTEAKAQTSQSRYFPRARFNIFWTAGLPMEPAVPVPWVNREFARFNSSRKEIG
jgi:hypothetical protein